MRDFSFIKQNILQFLESEGISKYEFYHKTGISNGILSQKNGLSEENILKFLSYFPEINLEWLFLRKGDMIRNKDCSEEIELLRENRELRKEIDFLRMKVENLEKSKHLKNALDSVCQM